MTGAFFLNFTDWIRKNIMLFVWTLSAFGKHESKYGLTWQREVELSEGFGRISPLEDSSSFVNPFWTVKAITLLSYRDAPFSGSNPLDYSIIMWSLGITTTKLSSEENKYGFNTSLKAVSWSLFCTEVVWLWILSTVNYIFSHSQQADSWNCKEQGKKCLIGDPVENYGGYLRGAICIH